MNPPEAKQRAQARATAIAAVASFAAVVLHPYAPTLTAAVAIPAAALLLALVADDAGRD